MKNRYNLYRVKNTITVESSKRGDYASSEPTDTEAADLRDALKALDSDCWDNVDMSGNSIVCYPADYSQSMATGDYSASELIIHGESKDLERLLTVWEITKRKARERRV